MADNSVKQIINFRKTVFLDSVADVQKMPKSDLPVVLMAGKSNVGKSSLINALTGGRIAKVSSTPGKTRLLNRFLVDDALILLDLPGYGFAKTSAKEKVRFSRLTEAYLAAEPKPDLVLLLLDSRHEPNFLDRLMVSWLDNTAINWIPVLTKVDKISRSAAVRRRNEIAKLFFRTGVFRPVLVSAEKRLGIGEMRAAVAEMFGYGVLDTD
jgi:GTP-binding protein